MRKLILFYLFTFAFCLSAFAQTLTVREIMRERPSSWTDEYTRILMFFEKHLK